MLTSDLTKKILDSNTLPRPREQFENLILWLGENQTTVGDQVQDFLPAVSAVGAVDPGSLAFILQEAIDGKYASGRLVFSAKERIEAAARLTMAGWDLYENLIRGKAMSRIAFMAMKFGDEEGDGIFRDHFKPAVEATGFELKRLDEGQPAGLIDDRLRVEIRQSRFLIADLTHHNNGAYWEAGFAEGLGKPVIYTCRKDQFDKGTHFDTNHHLTVVWEPGAEDKSARKLKDTIRATLPGEATLSD